MTPDHTLAEHRRAFLTANHFDGPPRLIEWVRLGPLPIPIPNPPARRRALRLHDLHHLITGYATDWQGEWQISAWEVGGGLYRNPVAWMFCLMGMTAGMVVAPRLTLRAYARGRRGRTLLGQDPDAVDRLTLAEGRAFCGVDAPPPPVTAADIPRAIGWSLLGALVALLPPLAWALSRLDRAPTVFVPAPAARTPAPADGDTPVIERTATPA